MPLEELVVTSLRTLYSDVISPDRFRHWKHADDQVARALADVVIGEIYWEKAVGRPATQTLSEGVIISSWRTERFIIPKRGGLGTDWGTSPLSPRWWDGSDDEAYWRVSYMIPNVRFGHLQDIVFGNWDQYTFVVPSLRDDIAWDVPGGQFGVGNNGIRYVDPPGASFVKEQGAAHVPFRIALKSPLSFDADGVAEA